MKETKPRVVIFIDWFLPAYKAGGPIKSVNTIIQQIHPFIEFTVISSNRDLGGELLDVPVNQLIERKNYSIVYLEKTSLSIIKYWNQRIQPNTVYFNSLFSFSFTLIPYLFFRNKRNIKKILAPRGMLGDGALKLKPLKKSLFIWFTRLFIFRKDLKWHASTEGESKEVKINYGDVYQIKIAQNLSILPQNRSVDNNFKKAGSLKLVFISRISEKKNLIYAIELIKSLPELVNLTLEIYGPIENDEYWNKCQQLMGSDIRISYKGILKPNDLKGRLEQFHLFVLPTQHENYGHAIVESISYGIPVLISNNTPWKSLDDLMVGSVLDLNEMECWRDKLNYFYQMDQNTYLNYIAGCFEYAKNNFVNQEHINSNKELFGI